MPSNIDLTGRPVLSGALTPVVNLSTVQIPTYITGITSTGYVPTFPGDTGFIDAFGRQRFSEPYTIFDSKQIVDDPDLANTVEPFPLFYDQSEVSGAGTSTTFNVNRASTTLAVSANTAGVRIRQTKRRFNYQPGKSQVAIFTMVDLGTTSGITKEIGLFNDNNGLFFRSQNGVQSVVTRSFATGAVVDRVFTQAEWNQDPMNGNGDSGVNLDFVKSHIPFVDFEWLGAGRVRYGWFIDGLPIYCHTVNNANNLDVVYMSTPNLPIRARIANDGTGPADSLEQICTSVISEGGVESSGITRSGDIGALAAAGINAGVINTTYAICGFRLKTAYLAATVEVEVFSIIETGNGNFLWRVLLNPTLTTGLTYADKAQSAVQFGVGAPAGDVITNLGYQLESGYASNNAGQAVKQIQGIIKLGAKIDGTRDQIVLSGTPFSPQQNYFGSLTWSEVV